MAIRLKDFYKIKTNTSARVINIAKELNRYPDNLAKGSRKRPKEIHIFDLVIIF